MSDYQKPVRKKNALNNPKIRMSAPNPNVKGVFSTLSWDLYQNNPRIIADTKDPSLSSPDNGYGRITAALEPITFGIFLGMLETAIKSKEAFKNKIETFSHEYVNNQRSQEAIHSSDIWVGKDTEGHVFMSVVSKKPNFPVIKFIFGTPDQRYHKFYHADGTPLSKAELSVYAAIAYLNLLRSLVPSVMDTHYYEAPPNPNWKNNNGGGNRGYNSNNGGGYKKPAAPANSGGSDIEDNDIPF